jgi:hypothetical protein
MQGLFRKEIEPRATGHKPWIAFINQRRTSSDVSFFFMYRCYITPKLRRQLLPWFRPRSGEINGGQVFHPHMTKLTVDGYGGRDRGPVIMPGFRLHIETGPAVDGRARNSQLARV